MSKNAQKGARRPGRPPKIHRQQVIDAAVELAESDGLEAVSLRAVAAKLDVTMMALYGHIDGMQELVDRVFAEISERWAPDIEWPPASEWEATLKVFAHSRRALLLEHPVMLKAAQRQSFFTGPVLRDLEHVYAALGRAGLDADAALDACVALHAFVYGFVAVELARSDPPPVTDERIRADRDQLRQVLEGAPDEFPNLLAIGEHAMWSFTDEQFDRSLRMFIATLPQVEPTSSP